MSQKFCGCERSYFHKKMCRTFFEKFFAKGEGFRKNLLFLNKISSDFHKKTEEYFANMKESHGNWRILNILPLKNNGNSYQPENGNGLLFAIISVLRSRNQPYMYICSFGHGPICHLSSAHLPYCFVRILWLCVTVPYFELGVELYIFFIIVGIAKQLLDFSHSYWRQCCGAVTTICSRCPARQKVPVLYPDPVPDLGPVRSSFFYRHMLKIRGKTIVTNIC
jgi:hypothetical protein